MIIIYVNKDFLGYRLSRMAESMCAPDEFIYGAVESAEESSQVFHYIPFVGFKGDKVTDKVETFGEFVAKFKGEL